MSAERPAKQLWRNYLRLFEDMRRWLSLSIAGTALRSLTAIPVVWLIRYVFDDAIPNGSAQLLLLLGAALIGLQLLNMAASLGLRALNIRIMETVARRLRARMFDKLYTLPRTYYANVDNADLHTAIVQDTQRVKGMSNALVSKISPGIASSVVLLALLVYLSWTLTAVMMTVVPLMLLLNRAVSRRVRDRIQAFQRAFARFAKGTHFAIRALDLTHAQSFERRELERQHRELERLQTYESKMAFICAVHGQTQGIVVALSAILILVVGGAGVADGSTTLGSFFAFYFVASMLNQNVRWVIEALPQVFSGQESLSTLFELIEAEGAPPYTGTRPIDFKGRIRLRDVTFGYDKDRPVLLNVDLDIEPGARISIAGANGAGKSTLVHLILGFYRPWSGRLEADRQAYEDIDIQQMRRSFGIVLQSPFLFAGTVRENISYGNPDVRDEDIWKACELSLAKDFIEALPKQLDTELGDEAGTVSGGQRQRIVVARALLRRPRLIILDEPTTSMDPEAVQQLIDNLKQLPERPAIITISHDERLLRQASEQLEIREGRLVPRVRLATAL